MSALQQSSQAPLRLNLFALPSLTSVLAALSSALIVGVLLLVVINSPLLRAWPAALGLLAVLTARRLLALPERALRDASPPGPELAPLQARLETLAAGLGVTPPPRLLLGAATTEPQTVGALRRRFFLLSPGEADALLATLADPRQEPRVDALLLHELHHFRHGDNLLLGTVEALLGAARDLILWGCLLLLGLLIFLRLAAADLLGHEREEIAARVALATGSPGSSRFFLDLFPQELWDTAKRNISKFDVDLLIFFLVANLTTVVLVAIALLLFWRALLRLREIYADAGVAQAQMATAPLLDALGRSAFPLRARQPDKPWAWRPLTKPWPGRLDGVRLRVNELLAFHPGLGARRACLRAPERLFGDSQQAALLIGMSVTVLNLLVWNSSAVLLAGRWPLHLPVFSIALLACLWALPRLVLGESVWPALLRLTLVALGCYAVPLVLTPFALALAGLIASGWLAGFARQFAAFVTGASQHAEPIVLNGQLIANAALTNLNELVLLLVLALALGCAGKWLAQRMLTWYALPRASTRLVACYLLVLAVLGLVTALVVLPAVTDLLLMRWEQLATMSWMSSALTGVTLGAVGGAVFLWFDRRYAGRCPYCGAASPGPFMLGKCCTTCGELLHPWLGTRYHDVEDTHGV